MKSDLDIWNDAAQPWASDVTKPGSSRSVHLKSALDKLLGPTKDLEILDAGCGDGVFTNYLSELGARVVGIDGSEKMTEQARVKYPSLNFATADLLKTLPFKNSQFDLVLANMVLMHLKDIGVFVAECKRTLKPGGSFIFSVLHPCFNFPTMKLYKSFWDKILFRKPGGLAYDYFNNKVSRRFEQNLNQELTHYHRTIEDYSEILNQNGFSITRIVEPHELSPEYLKENPKMEYTTRLPRFLFIKATSI